MKRPSESDDSLFAAFRPHLRELRRRIILSALAFFAASTVSFIFAGPLMELLARPVGGLGSLQSLEVTENFTASFNVALLGGAILASPVILYQIVAFIVPGLKENERRFLRFLLPASALFFTGGVLFAFFALLPAAIPFLTGFMGIPTRLQTGPYFSFTTALLFWIGIVFELPVAVFLLAKARVLSAALLLRNWRIAIVVIAVLAMLITPTVDPVNMLLLMAPLVILFFISISFAKIAERGALRK